VKEMVDLPANRYTIEHDHSVLKYRAMTDADYGHLFCWAENAVGEQVSILPNSITAKKVSGHIFVMY
jgi:hypothetical protein